MKIFTLIDLFVQRRLAALCLCSLFIGFFAGEYAARLAPGVPWMLAVLTFSSALGLRVQDLSSIRERPWILPFHLALLHAAIPLVAYGISSLFAFPMEAVMGFVILAIMPLSATCVVWTALYNGNVTMAMSLLLVDMVIAPFIIPYALEFLFGTGVTLDPLRMLWTLFWVLAFPTILAVTSNRATSGGLQRFAGKPMAFLAKMAMLAIMCINGGVVAPFMHDFDMFFFSLTGLVFFFHILWYASTFFLGRLIFAKDGEVIAFMYSSSIRGTATGVVIAMTFFPPLTTLTVVLSMLFQQPLASYAGKASLRYFQKRAARLACY